MCLGFRTNWGKGLESHSPSASGSEGVLEFGLFWHLVYLATCFIMHIMCCLFIFVLWVGRVTKSPIMEGDLLVGSPNCPLLQEKLEG